MALLLKHFLEKSLALSEDWRILLLANWNPIMGNLAPRVRLEKIETLNNKNILTIGVYESVWMQELHMLASVLVRTINQKLGNNYVAQLRFKLIIKQQDLRRTYTPKAPLSSAKRTTLTMREQEALRDINNPELEQTLKTFLFRCTQTN